ncbi:hypothetical protein R9X49_21345 [Pectobacterium carotovorum]|uniref:hypothetical protein n=1 Tax=Pectobacterium carotovorum TaxID=554 RepID=UPI0029D6F389|nr:hypothetical protein [Pectobacterium carotovorum]MDX6917655.1 hypothetical protein [Pectobacterium carotovorum]
MRGNLIFRDNNTGNKIVFNYLSWVDVITAVIFKYTDKSKEECSYLLRSSQLIKNATNSYMSVVLCSHEIEYHWAMLIAYGDLYWKNGVSQDEPDGYWEWESEYRKANYLAEESFIFINGFSSKEDQISLL